MRSLPPRRGAARERGARLIDRLPRPSRRFRLPPPLRRPETPSIGGHAQIFIVAFGVLVGAGTLVLALPWVTRSGERTPFADALMTAMGAGSGTFSPLDTADHWNGFGQVVILVLLQAGGLGFMVGTSLVLQVLRRGSTSLRDALLLQAGAPTLSLREGLELSGRIVRFTLVVEGLGAVALAARFATEMPWPRALWYGLFHAVSAFSNAGFDLQGGFRSLSPYRSSVWVNLVVIVLVQLGALSYVALADVWAKRRWRPLALDTKLVLVLNGVVGLGGAALFLVAEWDRSLAGRPGGERALASLFQGVAARTAGFATVDLAGASSVTLFVFVGLMLVGGASGSTAGGVKLSTVGIVLAAVVSTLRGEEETHLWGRRIGTPPVFRAMTIVALFVLAHFALTLGLALTEQLAGADPAFIDLMFEAMSALSSCGLSTGILPSLSTAGKLLLCAAMFLGRVGPLTAAYSLQRRQGRARYRFPEAAVRIG